MDRLFVTLTLKSVHEIVWCYHSNETSSAELIDTFDADTHLIFLWTAQLVLMMSNINNSRLSNMDTDTQVCSFEV